MDEILILGKDGQLGREFCRYCDKKNINYQAFSKAELDITDFSNVAKIIKIQRPKIIINCTAYNQVDLAEKNNKLAFQINELAVKNLAMLAKQYKIKLIHYSSDYVFDGTKKEGLYVEEDEPNPINQYGKSKLAGEIAIQEILDDFLIFRVSWVYGIGQQNFIYKLLKWSEKQDVLQIADDEVSVPTSTRTITHITWQVIEEELNGLYHLTNQGSCSRYEWAKEIFRIKNINKEIQPVSKDSFNLPAKRPGFSAMDSSKLGFDIKNWQSELEEMLD